MTLLIVGAFLAGAVLGVVGALVGSAYLGDWRLRDPPRCE
jgi:hypothetical protein